MNTPEVFEVANEVDPKEWIEKYRIFAKLNKWNPEDWIDFVQLYLGKRESIWQEDYDTIEELEYHLEELLGKLSIKDDNHKLNWLISVLSAEDRDKVRDLGYETWKEIIDHISSEEQRGITRRRKEVENRLRESRRPRHFGYLKGPIKCYSCGEEGHKAPECPKKDKGRDKGVNYIELAPTEELNNELFDVQRGLPTRNTRKPYDNIRSSTMPKAKVAPPQERRNPSEMEVEHAAVPQVTREPKEADKQEEVAKTRQKLIPKITEGSATTDTSSTPVVPGGKPTNKEVDTGAACSVATPKLAYVWGLSTEQHEGQVIITADGKRHTPLGLVKEVPVQIGKYIFYVDITIMDIKEDVLILGTDWLYNHRASVDLAKGQLSLPIGQRMLISPLHMRTVAEKPEWEETEVYLILGTQQREEQEENIDDPRIVELVAENQDLFIENADQLTQTDVTQHTIELTTERPIKQRPCRIPYHLFEKVRAELDMMERNGKNCHWEWTTDHQAAVEELKKALCDAPVLSHPNWSEEFIVTTDASVVGIGAILSQQFEDGEKPICFLSRILNPHERNYSVAHLEGLAVVWAVKKLKMYLWGKHFTIRTDHKSLLQLSNGKDIAGRVARWAMILRNYDYSIEHCAVSFILTHIVQHFGVPNQIITDRGSGFISEVAEQLYKQLEIRHTPTTPYRPQSNGQAERLNQTLKNTLVRQCRANKKNWDKYIWKSLLAIRTMRNKSTKYSPAELLYGTQIVTPSLWTPPPDADDIELAIQEQIKSITSELPEMRTESITNNIAAKERDKQTYNRTVKVLAFKVGDLVLKMTEQTQSKLEEIWEGPYKVENALSRGTYIISDSDGNRDLVHGDMLKQFLYSRHMIPEVTNTLKSRLHRFKITPGISPIW
ncbi:Retrovirus-related Pol polyprotein from transposon [Zancudomyces culisetae]|uniref:Retrovirus-related Pol polyprotein from transposon n=1 Tax=Zancudomyces culisetae TaxID=1213189 RepID=A0A1R1PQT5_ZANCU|nr:Retrovirus-related Pol polyprotein from transposon [Zancudomyces culisetae]|eukprot:OMH83345.1 Retrovirus-related Pol polyprotein from transposon [Zancudomyces culisetae]